MTDIQPKTDGLFLYDKPEGISSHDAVYRLRHKLGIQKIGHGGTLDPLATGLLIMLVGKATKMQDKLQTGSKVYSGTFALGKETDTWDSQGKIVAEAPIPNLDIQKLTLAINKLSGEIKQQVPPFSAVKHNGEKLYKIAREGREVPLIFRKVNVKWLDYSISNQNTISFRVQVSGGTYIRTLARDLGLLLGTKAHMISLRRELIGLYSVKDAINQEQLDAAAKAEIQAKLISINV